MRGINVIIIIIIIIIIIYLKLLPLCPLYVFSNLLEALKPFVV